MQTGGYMDTTAEQRTGSVTEFQYFKPEMQSLREYIALLKTSIDRYEYLKESGVSDAILYMEKGLIDQQLLFFSKAWAKLTK